jgi:phosphate transport system permease protein
MALSTFVILAFVAVILTNIVWQGWEAFSWRFVSSRGDQNMFDHQQAGVLQMIVGTSARVILMTIFVMPIGVITAIYLTEYARRDSILTTVIRSAVNNLAGVPSIVFGLFGLGFFVNFIGANLDLWLRPDQPDPYWRNPALIWASLTLAVMTLPVVIVSTEEALRAIPHGLREASMALGATRLETILRIVIPQALPGIMTGGILAIGRAAGEVAPILFTGAAYYMSGYPGHLTDQFMDLGYHTFILSTQSPDIEATRPILYATVITLLLLTFTLNFITVLMRARIRRKLRAFH